MENILVVMDNGTKYSGNYLGMNEYWIFLTNVTVVEDPNKTTENSEEETIASISLPKAKVSNIIFDDERKIDEFMARDNSLDPILMRRRRFRG